MICMPPLIVTDSMLVSSTAYEVAPAAYSAGTTYALGAVASVAGAAGLITVYRSKQAANVGNTPASSPAWWAKQCETYQVYSGAATYGVDDMVLDPVAHKVYRSLQAGNVGNSLINTSFWAFAGTSNKFAMFDFNRSKGTRQQGPLVVEISPGRRIDSIGLVGVVGPSVTVTMTTVSGVVYTRTISMTGRRTTSWYSYFFGDFRQIKSVLLLDLPPFANATITVTVNGDGEVACGACVLSSRVYMGEVELGPSSPGLNFSTAERDEFGDAELTPRRSLPNSKQVVHAPASLAQTLHDLRDDMNARVGLWSGLDEKTEHPYFNILLILGFYTQFEINMDHPSDVTVQLALEEI